MDFNLYKDSSQWKPYHHDAAAIKPHIAKIQNNIEETENNIRHINDYSIRYFEQLYKKFKRDDTRKTEIVELDTISSKRVIVTNKK